MVNVLKYSSLIYSGNVSVLLLVAIATDYWEYRGFDLFTLNRTISQHPGVRIVEPVDTQSYVAINVVKAVPDEEQNIWIKRGSKKYIWKSKIVPFGSSHIGTQQYHKDNTVEEPSIFIRMYYRNTSVASKSFLKGHFEMHEIIVVLFWRYGNLFRDCLALEGHVRHRLSMSNPDRNQCRLFLSDSQSSYADRKVENVPLLEILSLSVALLSVGCSLSTVIFGAIGSFDQSKRALLYASVSSLVSGLCLLLSIGLFDAKSNVLRKKEVALDLKQYSEVLQKSLNENRIFVHGWSFVLAWICVGLSFISSFVWLYKREGRGYVRSKSVEKLTIKKRIKRMMKTLEHSSD